MKKKLIITAIVSVFLVAAGTFAFRFFRPRPLTNPLPQDLADPKYQNRVLEKPRKGTAFEGDLIDNIYIAIGVLRDKDNYQVVTDGTASAKALMTFNQTIKGRKQVRNGEVFNENISYGPRSVAVRHYVREGDYIIQDAKSVSKTGETVWEAAAQNYSKEDFLALYGVLFKDFSQYIFNEHSIQKAELADKTADTLTIKYTLDLVYAPEAYRREVKTMSGANQFPEFLSVTVSVTMNKDWEILKTFTEEVYYVNVFGTVKTTGRITNVFSYEDREIAERADFAKYFGKTTTVISEKEKTATDHLLALLAPVATDPDGINLAARVTVNDYALDLQATVKLTPLEIRLKLADRVFAEYSEGMWYLKCDALFGKLASETLKTQFGFDLEALLSEEGLAKIGDLNLEEIASFETIGNLIAIRLALPQGTVVIKGNLDTAELISLEAALLIKGQTLRITAALGGMPVPALPDKEAAAPLDKFVFELDQFFQDKTFKVKIPQLSVATPSFPLSFSGEFFVDLREGLKAAGSVRILFNEELYVVQITVIGQAIYISYHDNIKVRLAFDDVSELLKLVKKLFNLDLKVDNLQQFKDLKLDAKTLALFAATNVAYRKETGLALSFPLPEVTEPAGFTFKDRTLTATFPFGIAATITASPLPAEILIPEGYFLEYKDLQVVLEDVARLMQKQNFRVELDGEFLIKGKPTQLSGTVYLDISNGLDLKANLQIKRGIIKADVEILKLGDKFQVKHLLTVAELTYAEFKELALAANKVFELNLDQLIALLPEDGTHGGLSPEALASVRAKAIVNSLRFTEAGLSLIVDPALFGLELAPLHIAYIQASQELNINDKAGVTGCGSEPIEFYKPNTSAKGLIRLLTFFGKLL